jgi:hypothetical protein
VLGRMAPVHQTTSTPRTFTVRAKHTHPDTHTHAHAPPPAGAFCRICLLALAALLAVNHARCVCSVRAVTKVKEAGLDYVSYDALGLRPPQHERRQRSRGEYYGDRSTMAPPAPFESENPRLFARVADYFGKASRFRMLSGEYKPWLQEALGFRADNVRVDGDGEQVGATCGIVAVMGVEATIHHTSVGEMMSQELTTGPMLRLGLGGTFTRHLQSLDREPVADVHRIEWCTDQDLRTLIGAMGLDPVAERRLRWRVGRPQEIFCIIANDVAGALRHRQEFIQHYIVNTNAGSGLHWVHITVGVGKGLRWRPENHLKHSLATKLRVLVTLRVAHRKSTEPGASSPPLPQLPKELWYRILELCS